MTLNVFQQLTSLGTYESMPILLRKKVVNANFIAIVFSLLCVPFIVFTYYSFPSLTIYPTLFLFNCGAILFFNFLGSINLSRFLACVVNISIYTIYHCYLLADDQPLVGSLYAIQIVFWMMPWMLFDLNEKLWLVLYVIYYLALSLSIPFLNNVFTEEHNIESFKAGFLGNLVIIIATIGITGPLFFFMLTNYLSEKRSMRLVVELEEQKKELLEKEQKLIKYVQAIEVGREEDKKRSWISDGLAKFSEIMRNHDEDIELISTRVLSSLVKFIDANHGGIFIFNDEVAGDHYLELTACYAYERKKFLQKRINIGDGLVGQCFLERRTIFLKEIPGDYVRITSGLGSTMPSVLVLVPIKAHATIHGVIELAAFHEIPKYKIEFLEKLCELLAATITSVKSRESIRRLLAESQKKVI